MKEERKELLEKIEGYKTDAKLINLTLSRDEYELLKNSIRALIKVGEIIDFI